MAREIKFRAWDGERARLVYDMTFTKRGVSCRTLGGQIKTLINPPLMQYTGMLDENGAQIYEGDVIKNGRGSLTTIVQWDVGSAGWTMEYLPNPGTNYTRGWSVAAEWASYQVIGNVYEDPELLHGEGK